MGIKNIHITLISASSMLSLIFGVWALNHDFQILGYLSLIISVGLVVYGVQFIKKAKAL
jgi:hypothetical protein